MGALDFSPPQQMQRDNTIPRFHIEPVQNRHRSALEGRPVFEDKEFVEIIIAGDSKSIVDCMVTDEHRARWPQQYAAFKAGQEAPLEGTPIEEWAQITKSQAAELKSSNVRTVEQLAELPDNLLNKAVPMGGHALRDKARIFIEQAQGAEPALRLQAQIDRQNAEMAQLRAQVAALSEGKTND